jgi:photosystem II stability/assembly factor-like uncharacterized protein
MAKARFGNKRRINPTIEVKMNKKILSFLILVLLIINTQAQLPMIEVIATGAKTSLRGLSVVNDNIVWVSGSAGTVGRSVTGGKNWTWMTVKGFEKVEFRDIEAFDASTAIIMGIGEPAYILKTTDGGENWKLVYENNAKGMFLDAMDFTNDKNGMVIGDPINGKIFMITTTNGGDSWTLYNQPQNADSGEAFFAASGTNLRYFNDNHFFLASGGSKSNLFTVTSKQALPIVQGKETTGANSIDIYDLDKSHKKMIVVGGDFAADSSSINNCFYSTDGGKNWRAPKVPPHGYRSCVEYLSDKILITCGTSGVDYSKNGGRNWQLIHTGSFNVCRIAKQGSAVYLAGNKGTVAKISWK